jgi:transposase-like protein
MEVRLGGERVYLWRAVDDEGEVTCPPRSGPPVM